MSRPSLIYDPKAGGDVTANLDFAADGLTVFDGSGRKLQHWLYPEITHAFPAGAGKDEVLAHPSRPEFRLQIRDSAVYEAVRARAPQLRPIRRGWKTFWKVLWGMPQDAQLGLYLLAGIVAFAIYGLVAGLFE